MQCVWVYEHPVDLEGLNRFHRNAAASIGGRLIERSPLPFGRPRWVRPVGQSPPMTVSSQPRSRSELLDWADEFAQLPIDPERGPGWRLGIQPLTDGATAVSLVGSHVLFDGVGAVLAIYEAITGNVRDLTYAEPGSRSRWQAVSADLRQTVRDLPLTTRTAVKAAKVIREKRRELAQARGARADADAGRHVHVPSTIVYVDVPQWDAKAESLGGNSYSLVAGFAAKMAEHLGRRRAADGAVTLVIAINLRDSWDDDRAIAMSFANATVDPTHVTTDLTEARTKVREAREAAKSNVDPTMELLALIPWLSRGGVKGVAELMFSYSDDLPVSCSNLGDLPPELARIDGSDAEYMFIRAVDTDVTLSEMKRSQGQLVVVSGRINGKVSISVEAYQLGAENTKERLRGLATQTLAEFGLTGVVE